MKIEIEIGELLLHGWPPGSQRQVAAAARRELARLAASSAWPAGLAGAAARLDALPIRLGPATDPGQQGRAIAGRVFAALGGTPPGAAGGQPSGED